MDTHLVVIADSARAQLFGADTMFDRLSPLDTFEHPAGRAKVHDLVDGDRGSTRGHDEGMKSRFERHSDPHQAAVDAFARELAERLGAARVEHRYERLVLVAPPTFLGLLRGHLDRETERAVVASIAHDWIAVPWPELPDRLRSALADQRLP